MITNLPPGRFTGKPHEYIFDECPGCQKPEHFYFNVSKGVGKCFSCTATISHRAQLENLQLLSSYDLVPLARREPAPRMLDTPTLWEQNAWESRHARGFLIGRGISERLSRQVPFYYLEEERALTVAVDPVSPEYPRGFVYRRPHDPHGKWMTRPNEPRALYGFGLEAWRRHNLDNLILMEGIFDVLSPGLWGHAVALLGTTVSDAFCAWLRENVRGRCFIWTDADRPGQRAARELYAKLYTWGVKADVFQTDDDPKNYDHGAREVRKIRSLVGATHYVGV